MLTYALPKDAVMHHSHNEGKRSKADAAKAKAMGQLAGFCDLIIFWAGQVFMIEFKSATGRQEANQIEFEQNMKATGFSNYAIVRDLHVLEAVLRGWGIPLRVVGNARPLEARAGRV